jgi:hypothetical protein
MEADLRSRVVSLAHQGNARDQRITNLEAWQRQTDISEAKRGEQFKSMDARFGRIEADLTKINGTLAKIMWLVIGGIIMAMVTFMVKGGFAP